MKSIGSKFIAVICFQTVFVFAKKPDFITDEMMGMIVNDKVRCMKEHGTTEAIIEEVNNGNMSKDRSLTCYMYCLLESFSLVDEDGALEEDMLLGLLPENLKEIAAEAIPPCAKTTGDDVCDKMYQIGTCLQQKRPDLWFMV